MTRLSSMSLILPKNFCFCTSLWCRKRFYECLKGLKCTGREGLVLDKELFFFGKNMNFFLIGKSKFSKDKVLNLIVFKDLKWVNK